MASSFTVNGSNTTINFSYTAPTATMISVVGDAAEYAYRASLPGWTGAVPEFDAMTNSQKLALVEEAIKAMVIKAANANKANKARAAEEANGYSL